MATDDQENGKSDGPRVITVSRDALRADLNDLELRMRAYISAEMDKKANADTVARLQVDLDRLSKEAIRRDERTVKSWENFENGNMSPNQVLAIKQVAQEAYQARVSEGWSLRERVTGILMLLIAIAGLAFTAVYTINSVEHNNVPTPAARAGVR